MKIMLTNDDGVSAAGINALARELAQAHEVVVVAPDGERSASSHSVTLTQPLRLKKAELYAADVEAYSVSGTPADCVIVGCNMLGIAPDIIISGINHGYNLGADVHYSGTVGAAVEGALLGVKAMAVSLRMIESRDFAPAARVAAKLIPEFMESDAKVFNVNVPDLPYEGLRGIKYTPLSKNVGYSPLERRVDPRGVEYFWWPKRAEFGANMAEDSDERWTAEGFVSVTPLLINYSDTALLEKLRKNASR